MGAPPGRGEPAVAAGPGPAAGTVVAPVTVVRQREEEPCP